MPPFPASFAKFVHWMARGAALFVSALFFYIVFSEIASPHSRPPQGFVEWIGIALLCTVIAGMLLCWKWEMPGALLSLFALVVRAMFVNFHGYPSIVLALACPGLLFLSDWALHYGIPHERNP